MARPHDFSVRTVTKLELRGWSLGPMGQPLILKAALTLNPEDGAFD